MPVLFNPFDGTIQLKPKASTTGSVISVNGQVGVVVLTAHDLLVGPTDDVTFNSVTASNLTANRAVVSDGAKKLISSVTTLAELAFVNGVTSAIQTQLNAKQATGNYITALTGDATATGPGSVPITLATVNGNVGSFGTASQVAQVTLNAKGLATAAANVAIQITESQVTNLVTDLAAKVTNPLTTNEDILIQRGGVPARLPVGANGTGLQVVAGVLTYVATPSPYFVSTISGNTAGVSGTTYLCNTSGAAFNLTLPSPVSGAFVIVKDRNGTFGTNNLTVVRFGAELIEGLAASKVMQTNWGSWSFFSDGTDWYMGPF